MDKHEQRARKIVTPFRVSFLGERAQYDYPPWVLRDAIAQALRDAIAQALREAEAEGMERAAKVVCPYCADGWPVNEDGWHTAPEGHGRILLPDGHCKATAIRGLKGQTQ